MEALKVARKEDSREDRGEIGNRKRLMVRGLSADLRWKHAVQEMKDLGVAINLEDVVEMAPLRCNDRLCGGVQNEEQAWATFDSRPRSNPAACLCGQTRRSSSARNGACGTRREAEN